MLPIASYSHSTAMVPLPPAVPSAATTFAHEPERATVSVVKTLVSEVGDEQLPS